MAKVEITWHQHWSLTCWYGFCPNRKTWERERRRVLKLRHIDIGDYPETSGMTACYRTPDPRALVVIHTELDDDPIRLVGTLAHEAVHVAMMAFEQMHEDKPGEEITAYAVDQIASHLFEAFILTRGAKLRKLAKT